MTAIHPHGVSSLEFDELELLVDVVCLFADALFVVEALERAVEVGFL